MSALFDMEPQPPPQKLSADRSRTVRQAAAIATGMHPLSLALSFLPLHPGAVRDPEDRKNGPRCGGCAFIARYGPHGYLKCLYGGNIALPRVSRGPGTDLRAWWPGCRDWEEAGG